MKKKELLGKFVRTKNNYFGGWVMSIEHDIAHVSLYDSHGREPMYKRKDFPLKDLRVIENPTIELPLVRGKERYVALSAKDAYVVWSALTRSGKHRAHKTYYLVHALYNLITDLERRKLRNLLGEL